MSGKVGANKMQNGVWQMSVKYFNLSCIPHHLAGW